MIYLVSQFPCRHNQPLSRILENTFILKNVFQSNATSFIGLFVEELTLFNSQLISTLKSTININLCINSNIYFCILLSPFEGKLP